MNALDDKGIDWLCDQLTNGATQRKLCEEIGIDPATMCRWLAADPQRSARAREARIAAARFYEEMAGQVIEEAKDQFGLAKAKELAHHYRWKASKANPKEFGDKVTAEHVGADGGAIQQKTEVTFKIVRPTNADPAN